MATRLRAGQVKGDSGVATLRDELKDLKTFKTNANSAFTEHKQRIDGFSFNQTTAGTSWIITHSLNKMPNVTVINGAGEVCVGKIAYTDLNTVTLTFSKAISGTAYLN